MIIKNLTSSPVVIPSLGISVSSRASIPVSAKDAQSQDVAALVKSRKLEVLTRAEFASRHTAALTGKSAAIAPSKPVQAVVTAAKPVVELEHSAPIEVVEEPVSELEEAAQEDAAPEAPPHGLVSLEEPVSELEEAAQEDVAPDAPSHGLVSLEEFAAFKKPDQIAYLDLANVVGADTSSKSAMEAAYSEHLKTLEG